MEGWSSLGTSKEARKNKGNTGDRGQPNGKVYYPHRGFHYKKHGEFCPQLPPIFPRFHSVKRRHRGRHCGSNPLQSRDNEYPLLCLTHLSPLWYYLHILLPLFLPQLLKFYFYCDRSVQLHISIYFQFCHDSINSMNTLLLLTLLFIFRFKNCFQNLFYFTNCHPPCIIKICTGVTNSILPQKAMTFLSGGSTTA